MSTVEQASEVYPPEWLLELLRCPISGQRLHRWNRGATELGQVGSLTHRDGRSVSDLPSQGLLSEDSRWLYPLHGPVACLVPGEAIALGMDAARAGDAGGDGFTPSAKSSGG